MGVTRRKFTLEFRTEAAHRVIDSGEARLWSVEILYLGYTHQPFATTFATRIPAGSVSLRADPRDHRRVRDRQAQPLDSR